MGDLSTREQIRGEAIDRIARAHYERVYPTGVPWDSLDASWRERSRQIVTFLVDALGDLLPTGPALGYAAMARPKDSDGPFGILIGRNLATDKLSAEMQRQRFAKDEDMHVIVAELREVTE